MKFPRRRFLRLAAGAAALPVVPSAPALGQNARPATSTASSRARSRPTCRCRRPPSTTWRSISRRRRHSALKCRQCCSPAPMRWSN